MKRREAKLQDFMVINRIYPDSVLLGRWWIENDVKDYFNECGFGLLFVERLGVFEGMVRDFAYSFETKWHIFKADESDMHVVKNM